MEEVMIDTALQIDKTAWRPVKFGNVVFEPKETCRDIVAEGIEHVVGLEHIDTGDLHLRKSASTEESTTFSKKFRKGDVLFGRRRAYLKKAAQADFDGICSGDITVFRAKKDLSPALLPFIVNNDKFFDYAVKHSAGGLSPRVKFKDLANYEFLLPSKAEQARLADLLWAMDEVIEKEKVLLEKMERTYYILVDNLFMKAEPDWDFLPVADIASINRKSLKGNCSPEYKFKYLDIAGIVEPKTIGDLITMKFKDAPSRARRVTSNNSIVMSLVRPYFKAFVHLDVSEDIIASTGTAVIDVSKKHNSKFIFHQFFSSRFMRFCEDRMIGTNYPAITPKDLGQYNVLIPKDFGMETKISSKIDHIDSSIIDIKFQILTSQSLQKSLINQIF